VQSEVSRLIVPQKEICNSSIVERLGYEQVVRKEDYVSSVWIDDASHSTQCDALIETYLPDLVQFILNNEDPTTACTQIHVRTSPVSTR
jgi:hypothetical protein